MDGSDRITALMADMDAHSRADFDDDVALFMKYRKMTPKGIMQLCESQQEEIKIKRDAISRLTAENERLRKLVRSSYNEGFNEGMDEFTKSRGGKPWPDSKSCAALTALATPTETDTQGSSTKSEE